MTNLPNSEQVGNLDNISVTRAEFRAEIGVLLEYIAQALGDVAGTYTTETVSPTAVVLQGTPTIEVGANPTGSDRSLRIPTTKWVKENGNYVSGTAPTTPVQGMLWIDTTTSPYQIKTYNSSTTNFDVLSGFPSGTKMLFQQTAAPSGWTKDTTTNNRALRVVSGTVGTGGTHDFTTAFASSVTITGTVNSHVLTVSQIPSHTHGVSDPGHGHAYTAASDYSQAGGQGKTIARGAVVNTAGAITGISIANAGGGQGHSHGFTGTALDLEVAYVDVIIATKN